MSNEAVRTALAVRDETSAVMLTNHQLTMIANTQFVPAAFRGNVAAVLACVATGRALGLPDMTALRGINVIDGKASLSAELMDGIVRSHGHSITGTVSDTEAVVRGKRADNGDEMEARFTIKMAEKAGLTGKSNWKKHPDDMLWARAVSKLCRRLFADCFAGATYAPDELEPTADELMDEPQHVDLSVSDEEISEHLAAEGGALVGSDDGAQAAEARPGKGPSGPTSATPPTPDEVKGILNPLKAFKQKATEAGIPVETMNATAGLLFPGRSAQSLTASELDELWERLVGDVRAAVD